MEQTTPNLIHGGDWAGFETEYGCAPLDFSANVSPLGVPESVCAAIAGAALLADRYPDPLCRALCAALAEKERVPRQNILCGNGAADLIFRAVLARRPKQALVTAPTFAEYETALATVGCTVRRYPLREKEGFRLQAGFLAAITPQTDLVFLCEPNNPTGITTPRALLLQIAQKCADCGALLVLDECFNDFLAEPQEHTLGALLPHNQKFLQNLLVLKAFTKLYGMAGVRLGYCLCADTALLEQMRGAGQPWAVSSLAQAAGVAALQETGYVQRLRRVIQTERPWLQEQLRALGLRVLPGEANYLLFWCAAPLQQPLRQRGVLVRNCENYPGLGSGWYRIAVRTHTENEKLIAALAEVL